MFSVASAHFADNIIKGIASYVFVYIAIRLSTACIIKKYRGFLFCGNSQKFLHVVYKQI